MILKLNISTLILLFGMSAYAFGTSQSQLSYLEAKQKAEISGKNYLLLFTADWCTPCQWMKETTLQEARLQSRLSDEIILVEIDIDEFEGSALKEYYMVNSLPTMILFNAKHKVVNRNEGSIGVTAFHSFLNTKNDGELHIYKAPNKVTNMAFNSENKSLPVVYESASSSLKNSDALYESVKHFSIQIGAYSSIEAARKATLELKQMINDKTEISSKPNGDQVVYKVLVGKFDLKIEAEEYKELLAAYNIKGFVKEVTSSNKS